jgi:queuine tRNA-ribosyltransferase
MKFGLVIDENSLDQEKNGLGRIGLLHTAHGDIHTPVFMPVATVAAMKAMQFDQLRKCGTEIILSNTYHLMIMDRYKIVKKMGGLHKFMNWPTPILTDCGGFQAMSLGQLSRITEEGINFSCHLSGTKYQLTPEFAVEIQHQLDSTITMALDECVRQPTSYEYTKIAMERSLRWAERSKKNFREREGYAIYGIIQGGADLRLREISITGLKNIDFDGYAIGGDLSINNGWKLLFDVLDYLVPLIPIHKPRYLMGVGKPVDIVGSVLRGIDQFDCVMPTRSGRNGQVFTRKSILNIKNASHAVSAEPLDDQCSCTACRQHTRAYLHHLYKSHEILAAILLSEHNIVYYQDLMQGIRKHLLEKNYREFARCFFENKAAHLY